MSSVKTELEQDDTPSLPTKIIPANIVFRNKED